MRWQEPLHLTKYHAAAGARHYTHQTDVTPKAVPNFSATVDHFASRLAADHRILSTLWLERLDALLAVEKGDVFPSHQLLDHIPELLREIAAYLRAPAEQEIAANTGVMTKAGELRLLRFDQRASVHQLLREYQILSEILESSSPARPRCSASGATRPRPCWC